MTDYRPAWEELHRHLSWMQNHRGLTGYLGMNFGQIAADLIRHAYPGLAVPGDPLPIKKRPVVGNALPSPRMTPTNDAPVTVEQCDREAARYSMCRHWPEWSGGYDSAHSDLSEAFARHRLAALASAPAGDGVEEALTMARDLIGTIEQTPANLWWVNTDDPETAVSQVSEVLDRAIAAIPSTSNGQMEGESLWHDAREIALKFALPGKYDGQPSYAVRKGKCDNQDYMGAIRYALSCAALARPRAAVGEQVAQMADAIEANLQMVLCELGHVLKEPEGGYYAEVQDLIDSVEALDRLALQSPPAKVAWVPQIGDQVEVAEGVADEALWRQCQLWVAGVKVHDSGDGFDVTVSEQWPIPSRVSRDYQGQTDDFRVGAANVADMLRPKLDAG